MKALTVVFGLLAAVLAVWVLSDRSVLGDDELGVGGPTVERPNVSSADAGRGEPASAVRDEAEPPSSATAQTRAPSPDDLVGIVIDPGDRSLPGARVTLLEVLVRWPRQSLRELGQVTSDGAGRFRFDSVPPRDLLLRVERDGLALQERYVAPAERDVRVHMSFGFDVAGVVNDPTGRGMGNCEVFLEPGSWAQFASRKVRTDANGAFRFANVAAGLVRVTARSPFYRPATAPMVTVGSGVRLRLNFGRQSPVTMGMVIEAAAEHRPVVGATVRVRPGGLNSSLFEPVTAITDETGQFELRGLGTGNLKFEVEHPEYSTATRGVTVRPDGEPVTFELVGRSTLRGRLRGALPTGDEELVLRVDTNIGERSRVKLEADGSFLFPDSLSAGSAQLEIEGGLRAFARSAGRTMSVMVIEQAQTVVELDIIEPSVVRGAVLDDTGRPLAGVRVSTPKNSPRDPARITSVTDASGRYEMRGLAPAEVQSTVIDVVQLTYEFDGRATATRAVPIPSPKAPEGGGIAVGAQVDVDPVQLVAAGILEGRVLRDGKGLAGVILFAGQLQRNQTAVTGPDGDYVMRGLAPRAYRLKARYSTLPLVTLPDSVEIVAGQRSVAPDINMASGRVLSGNVIEEVTRLPVVDAVVSAPGVVAAASRTDQNGRFEIEVPRRTKVLLVYSPDRSIRREVAVDRDLMRDIMVTLDIAPTARIRTRVAGLASNDVVTHGVVRVEGLPDSDFEGMPVERRSIGARPVEMSGGLLVADFVPAGKTRLTLQCQGFAPATLELDLEPGEMLAGRRIDLEPGITVHGVVLAEGGAPLQGARIYLGEVDDSLYPSFHMPTVETDASGKFAIGGVAPGARRIIALADGYAPGSFDVKMPQDLLRGPSNPLEMQLRRPSTIVVSLVDSDGEPTDDRTVVVRKGALLFARRSLDREGRVRIQTRGPGIYRISALGDDEVSAEVSAQVVVTDETQAHALRLQLPDS